MADTLPLHDDLQDLVDEKLKNPARVGRPSDFSFEVLPDTDSNWEDSRLGRIPSADALRNTVNPDTNEFYNIHEINELRRRYRARYRISPDANPADLLGSVTATGPISASDIKARRRRDIDQNKARRLREAANERSSQLPQTLQEFLTKQKLGRKSTRSEWEREQARGTDPVGLARKSFKRLGTTGNSATDSQIANYEARQIGRTGMPPPRVSDQQRAVDRHLASQNPVGLMNVPPEFVPGGSPDPGLEGRRPQSTYRDTQPPITFDSGQRGTAGGPGVVGRDVRTGNPVYSFESGGETRYYTLGQNGAVIMLDRKGRPIKDPAGNTLDYNRDGEVTGRTWKGRTAFSDPNLKPSTMSRQQRYGILNSQIARSQEFQKFKKFYQKREASRRADRRLAGTPMVGPLASESQIIEEFISRGSPETQRHYRPHQQGRR